VDEADRAAEYQQMFNDQALEDQKQRPALIPDWKCRWCDAPLERKGFYCDSDCEEDARKHRQMRGI